MRNFLLALLLLPMLAAIQSTVIAQSGWAVKARPDLVLVAVLAWNIASPHTESILWALIGGIAVDNLSGGPMGSTVVALLTATLLANFTSARVWQSHIMLRIIVPVAGSVLYYLVYSLVLAFSGWRADWTSALISVFLPSVAVNTALMLLLFPPARWLATRIASRTINI
jgi:rod shape-determining protein MreD|tara:strand:- start:145 stop:651 length:507 start_codon:yes stop_codon:yes gene_type:complete